MALLSHIKFDDPTNLLKDEVAGVTWTKYHEPTFIEGKPFKGYALCTPLEKKAALFGTLPETITGDITLEVWVYPKTPKADEGILVATANENYWTTSATDYKTVAITEKGCWSGSGAFESPHTQQKDIWIHKAFVRKGNKYYYFVNGKITVEGNITNPYEPLKYLILGGYYNESWPFQGIIKEAKVWNEARYDAEFVPEKPNFLDSITTDGLISYLKFDDSLNVAKDELDTDWTKIGTPVFDSYSLSGKLAYYNGTSNSGLHKNLPVTLNKDWTMECWVYDATGETSGQGILFLTEKPADEGYYLPQNKTTGLSLNQLMVNYGLASPIKNIPKNKWVHLAASHSHDESKTRFFYDGELVGESSEPSREWKSAFLGNSENQYTFKGQIDEVKIWNKCLYKTNFTPETPPQKDDLVLQIQIKDSTTQDLAGNILSGTWDLAPADIPLSPSGRKGFNLNRQNNVTAGPFLYNLMKADRDWTIQYYYYAPQALGTQYLFWGDNWSSSAFYIKNDGKEPYINTSRRVISYWKLRETKKWHHVALVNDSKKKKTFLYFNGALLREVDSKDYNDVSKYIGWTGSNCYVDNIQVNTSILYNEEWGVPEPQNMVLPIDALDDLLFLDTGENTFKDAGENSILGKASIIPIKSRWKSLWAHGSPGGKGDRIVSIINGPFKHYVFSKNNPWTIAFWYTRNTETQKFDNDWGSIFGYGNTFNVYSRPGKDSVSLCKSNDAEIIGAPVENPPFKDWTHFAFVNDPTTKQLTAYINGKRVSSVELTQDYSNKNDTAPIPILDGLSHAVENLCVVKKALWTSDFAPPQGHLVLPESLKGKSRYQSREHEILHLEFNDPDDLEKDTSGRYWNKVSDKNYKYVRKGFDGCYSCNTNTNGITSILPSPIKKGTPYTLEVTWKSGKINQNYGIAFLTSASTGVSSALTASEVGIGTYDFLFGNTHYGNISPAADEAYLKIGWHHSAISYDGTKFRCFIDGKKVYEKEDNFGDWTYNSILAGAWCSGSGYNLIGLMDEVILSDYAKYTEEFTPTLPEESGEILHLVVKNNEVIDLYGATGGPLVYGGLIPSTNTIPAPPSGNIPINAQGQQKWLDGEIASRSLTAQNDWTIHTWVYVEKEEQKNPVSICMTDRHNCSIYWFYPGKGLAYINRGQWVANNDNAFGEPEKWNHVALVNKADDKFRIFLNGKPVMETEPQEGFMIDNFHVGSSNIEGFYLDDFVVNEKKALWTSEFALKGMPEQSVYNKAIEDKVVTGLKRSDYLLDLAVSSISIVDNAGGILTIPTNFPLAQGRMRARKSINVAKSSKFNYSLIHKNPELKSKEPWTVAFYARSPQVSALLGPINTNGTDELGTVIPFSSWYHLALVNDGTNAKLFLNGELKKTIPSFSLDVGKDHPKDIILGGAQDTRIENFFIVKRALWSENFELPNGHFVYDKTTDVQWADGAELVHLKFNNTDDLFHDEGGNIWTYNFEGEEVWTFNSKRKKEGTGSGFAKKAGNGHAFFRMPEWFKGKQDFTLETWIYITNSNGSSYFFLHDQASPIMDHTNKNSLLLHEAGLHMNGLKVVNWKGSYSNRWIHFAIVRDGSTWGLFADGKLEGKWTGDIDFEPRWFVLNGYYDNRYSPAAYYDEVILTAGSKWKVDVVDPTFVPPYMITDGSDKPQNPNQAYPVPVESSDILLAVGEEEGNAIDHAKNPWTSLAGYKIKAGRWKDTRSIAFDTQVALSSQTGPLAEQVVLRKDEPWTVAFWFKQLAPQSDNAFILDTNSSVGGIQLNDRSYPGKSGMRLEMNSIVNLMTDWAEGNTWTYFTVVNDPGHNRIRLYYDGKLQVEKKNEKHFHLNDPSLGDSPNTLVEDFIIVKKVLWEDEFEPPTGRFPKPELLGFNYKYYLSGNKKIMFYVDKSNTLHQEDWSSLNPAQKTQKIHAASGNPLTKDMIASIKTATNSLIKVEYSSESISTMKKDISIQPKSQLVIPNKRYSLKGKTQVKAIKFEGENLNFIKVAFTDDLDHWFIWKDNDWQEILKKDIPTQGMAADSVSNISDLSKFVQAGYIGIGYFLPAGANLDKTLITVDSAGKWRRYNQDEASYQYPAQGKLEVTFIQEGSYKINFNKGEAKK